MDEYSYELETLPNGLRLAYLHLPHVHSVHLGGYVRVGFSYWACRSFTRRLRHSNSEAPSHRCSAVHGRGELPAYPNLSRLLARYVPHRVQNNVVRVRLG